MFKSFGILWNKQVDWRLFLENLAGGSEVSTFEFSRLDSTFPLPPFSVFLIKVSGDQRCRVLVRTSSDATVCSLLVKTCVFRVQISFQNFEKLFHCFNRMKALILLFLLPMLAESGPLAYGICQTGCNALVVSCYAAAGFTFGTITAGTGVPAAIIACNAALGTCMAGCIAAGFAPIP